MASPPFIGIDFGTCNSSVAWFNPQIAHAELLLNAEGEDKTPSVVYFGSTEVLVGRHAEAGFENREARKRVLSAVKRELARPRVWKFGERLVTPVQAAAEILKKLKRDAEEGQFHEAVERAVVTCPAAFDEAEKDKLREAAALAGFQEVELLEEPVAAAIAYFHAGIPVGRYVLVYDLGGGTFDLALLVREEGDETYRLAMEPRGERIGGEDFDQALYDYFDARIQQQYNCTVSAAGLDLSFLRQCRKCKESLSASEEIYPFTWRLPDSARQLELKISRAKFEGLIEGHVGRTIELTRSVRQEADAAGFNVETVILIGGSSRVPLIMRRLHEELHVEPRKWQKQDVAVALGAAYHAHSRWGEKREGALGASATPSAPSQQARDLLARAQAAFDNATQPSVKGSGKHAAGLDPLEEALRCSQAACDLEPTWADAVYLKGRILQVKKEWSLATAALTAALRLGADAVLTHRHRGLCRLLSGDNVGAKKDFDEVVQRTPIEDDYRRRAVAHFRLGDAAAALADVQTGLSLMAPGGPRTALHAIRGLLLRDELARPADALSAFAEALQSVGNADGLAGLPLFAPVCALFGVSDRLPMDKAAGRMSNAALPVIAAVQRALWQACKSVHGGCTRLAAVALIDHGTREIDAAIWKGDPDLGFHLAGIYAERKDADNARLWLGRLLKANPAFDIRLAHQDPCIGTLEDPQLRAFLTPRLGSQEQHGVVFNHVTVTNRSAFRVTGVTVMVTIQRTDGTTDAPIIQQLASLAGGASHRWSNLVKNTRLFGSNIRKVEMTLDCAEAQPPFRGASPPTIVAPQPQPSPIPMDETRQARDTVAPKRPLHETHHGETKLPVVEVVQESAQEEDEILILELIEEIPPATPKIPVLKPADVKQVKLVDPRAVVCRSCGFVGKRGQERCPKCRAARNSQRP